MRSGFWWRRFIGRISKGLRRILRIRPNPEICYLCGKPILADGNRDHVPPQQLFAPRIRQALQLNLPTLPTHRACNSAYKADEDYFTHTISAATSSSPTARAVLDHIVEKFHEGVERPLAYQVLAEFRSTYKGIVLPNDLVVMESDRRRIARVVWKITRGLFFTRNKKVLPETVEWKLYRGRINVDLSDVVKRLGTHAEWNDQFPGIFRHGVIDRQDWPIQAWFLVLWDDTVFVVSFENEAVAQ